MGIGDWILASGQARDLHAKNGLKCVFGKPDQSETYWHDVLDGLPFMEREPKAGMQVNVIPNYPGCRPYFNGMKFGRVDWITTYRAKPGVIILTDHERAAVPKLKEHFVVVEPHVDRKYSYAVNKDWGFSRWQGLVSRNKHIPWVQFDYGAQRLAGVMHVPSPSFRQACAILDRATLLVTTDGGLHHAAAALGVPAIVIWGGFVGPDMLGYDWHTNLRAEGVESCGNMRFCGHCRRALKAVTIEKVEGALSAFFLEWNDAMSCSGHSRRAAVHA